MSDCLAVPGSQTNINCCNISILEREKEREREREGQGTWKEQVTHKWFLYFSPGPEHGHSSLVRS